MAPRIVGCTIEMEGRPAKLLRADPLPDDGGKPLYHAGVVYLDAGQVIGFIGEVRLEQWMEEA